MAIAQTKHVIAALKKVHPGLEIEIKEVTTTGDRDRRTTLWNLKDTGFFTSQVEDVLLEGQADFAVHSFKDLPTAQREGLTIAAVFDRQFVEDCLIAVVPAGRGAMSGGGAACVEPCWLAALGGSDRGEPTSRGEPSRHVRSQPPGRFR